MPKGLILKVLLMATIGAALGAIAQPLVLPETAPTALFRRSHWNLLSDGERKTLQPLAERWEAMNSVQQKKWRAIAQKYPSLSLGDQQKIQRRMTRWSDAQPGQRDTARKKYKAFKQKKAREQEHLRLAWKNHKTKDGGNGGSATFNDENHQNDPTLTKEPDSVLYTENLRAESLE